MSPDTAPFDTDVPPTGPDRRRSRANRWIAVALLSFWSIELVRDLGVLGDGGAAPRSAEHVFRDVGGLSLALFLLLAAPRWKFAALASMVAAYGMVFWLRGA